MKLLAFLVSLVALVPPGIEPVQDGKRIVARTHAKDREKVEKAIAELAALGREGVEYFPQLLEDPRPWVRVLALFEIGKLGPAAQAILPQLVAHGSALDSPPETALASVQHAVAMEEAIQSQPGLRGALRDSPGKDADIEEEERLSEIRFAIAATASVAGEDLGALAELVWSVPRGQARTELTVPRLAAARALARLVDEGGDAAAAPFAPLVVERLAGADATARATALVIASGFDDEVQAETIVPAVAARLAAEEPGERALAAAVLLDLAPECEGFGTQLEPLLRDDVDLVRVFAAAALRRVCGSSLPAETALLEGLGSPTLATKVAAIDLLGLEGAPPKSALDPLIACLVPRNDPRLLIAACGALGKLGPDAKKAGSKVVSLMKHERRSVREAAGRVLDRIDR